MARFLLEHILKEENDGTRDFALVAGRAYSGDPSAVAVPGPLTGLTLATRNPRNGFCRTAAGPVFVAVAVRERALFRRSSAKN